MSGALVATAPKASGAIAPVDATLERWTAGHPRTGALIWRLDESGPVEISAFRADVGYAPASTMKIVTAASALINLGPEFRFQTRLVAGSASVRTGSVLRGPIYVKGYGDPVLSTPNYARTYFSGRGGGIQRLVAPLRKLGIRTIRGPIVADESFLSTRRVGPLWNASYVADSAPLTGLAINQSWLGDVRDQYVKNPPVASARRIKRSLKAIGIAQKGPLRGGITPSVARPIASVSSPPLREIVGIMLPASDNFIAEILLRDVGAYIAKEGTTEAGAAQTEATLEALGVLTGAERVVDGSGLSRFNRLTPTALVRVLAAADGDPNWGDPLIRGLARGGEGTLIRRLRDGIVRRRVRAKTGYISGVSALAGVVSSQSGARYAFAFLMNDPDIGGAHAVQDELVTMLASGSADGLAGTPATAIGTVTGPAAAPTP